MTPRIPSMTFGGETVPAGQTVATCLVCQQAFLALGAAAVARVGRELFGCVCPECLDPPSREQLTAMRREREGCR